MTGAHAYRWVGTQADLGNLLDEMRGIDRYAIDTEFHRERTYFPALALVQLAWGGDGDNIALVDPLAVDIKALAELFESDSVAVFHAAQQDFDVLQHAVGAVPRCFADTQLAAGFVGYGSPSLVNLLSKELGVTPAKGDRLTDWLQRPLTAAQCDYAASDVAYLLPTYDLLNAQLDEAGRRQWADDAYRELAERAVSESDPMDAWLKLKDARALRPRSRAIAQYVAAWRESAARERDIPVRQVLPDLAILGIAQRKPTTEAELAQARGVDSRFSRGKTGEAILKAVAAALTADPPEAATNNDELERDLRPAITLISAWVSQVARDQRVETAMLATRSDITGLLAGDQDSRLRTGWRAELLGDGIASLVAGRSGLTFDRGHGLRLVEVDE